jgi:Rrf2 family transcriptional regulator, iron-sulfur cluster assembly transcription factor
MLLGTKGRYAVMAMVEIARQGDGRPLSLGDVAERLQLSLPYLEQLFMKLRRKGLVRSVRGPRGGYTLGRDPSAISAAEIMAAAGEPFTMTRCHGPGEAGCVATKRCSTHHLWDALGTHIEEFLSEATLEDVLQGRFSAPPQKFSLSRLAAGAGVSS